MSPVVSLVYAQQAEPGGPIYIVQEGDSLWDIAIRFSVPLDSLANANGISDASQLSIGDELVIPGLEGVQGYLTTTNVSVIYIPLNLLTNKVAKASPSTSSAIITNSFFPAWAIFSKIGKIS